MRTGGRGGSWRRLVQESAAHPSHQFKDKSTAPLCRLYQERRKAVSGRIGPARRVNEAGERLAAFRFGFRRSQASSVARILVPQPLDCATRSGRYKGRLERTKRGGMPSTTEQAVKRLEAALRSLEHAVDAALVVFRRRRRARRGSADAFLRSRAACRDRSTRRRRAPRSSRPSIATRRGGSTAPSRRSARCSRRTRRAR